MRESRYFDTSPKYSLQVKINGATYNQVGPLILEPNEKWEGVVGFTVNQTGDNQKIEFELYKDGKSTPAVPPVYLWVNASVKWVILIRGEVLYEVLGNGGRVWY